MPQNSDYDAQKDIKALKDRVAQLEQTSGANSILNRYLPTQDKKVTEDAIGDAIIDIVWNKYFYYLSFFESTGTATGATWTLVQTGTGSGVSEIGVDLGTGANANDTTYIRKMPFGSNLIAYDKQSRFRTTMMVHDGDSNHQGSATSIDVIIRQAQSSYYGFHLVNNVLYGVCRDGTTEQTVVLMSDIHFYTTYALEARYYPGYKCVFYVSEGHDATGPFPINSKLIERGTLSAHLPDQTSFAALPYFSVQTTTTAARHLRTPYLEYIQARQTYQ